MTNKTKQTIIVAGLSVAAVAAYFLTKAEQISYAVKKIKLQIIKLRNVSFDWQEGIIKATMDVVMQNPTDQPIGAGTKYLTLKRIDFYQNGHLLGSTSLQLQQITIPANDKVIIKDVVVNAKITNLINHMSYLLNGGNFTGLFDMVFVVNFMGKDFRITEETALFRKSGLNAPRVCTNRIKCAGVTQRGKLRKGYKFQKRTGYVVKV